MILNSKKNRNTHIGYTQLTLCIFSTCLSHVILSLEKKWEQSATVNLILIDFKKMYESVKMCIVCSILVECGVHLLVFGLIKMCLNVTCYSLDKQTIRLVRFLYRIV